MTVVSHYSTGDMSNSALAEELLKINAGTLGTSGKEEYDSLTEKIYPRVCERPVCNIPEELSSGKL